MKKSSFIGVNTTKIYCLPSCPAKKPLPRNIVHFETTAQAERNGFRPCKRCFPDFPYGKWVDEGESIILKTPQEFEFLQCLKFLDRSPLEPCHTVDRNILYKLEKFEGMPVLLKIFAVGKRSLGVAFLTPRPKKSIRAKVAKYVWHWFDLDTDLSGFYRMAARDSVLKNITKTRYGLRMMAIPDLFEALCWAIIGQQINLTFAYTLKKRLVESFGETFSYDNTIFYMFPTPRTISRLKASDIKGLQFTGKKSEYIIELAKKMADGELTKKKLLNRDGFESARNELKRLYGVGQWTADYVSLRCLNDRAAFPVADVGLQNAVKLQLGLSQKPSAEDIIRLSLGWQNWQAYATFYLWASFI